MIRALFILSLSATLAHAQGLFSALLAQNEAPVSSGIASPEDVADLAGWYKPESLVGPPEGTITNTWVDSTANAYDLTQSTGGARPYLTNNVIDSFRGLYFDGSDDRMTFPSGALNWTRSRPGFTVMFVAKLMTPSTADTFVYFSGGSSANQGRAQLWVSASDATLFQGVARRLDADSAVLSDTALLPVVPFLCAARWDWANGAFKAWTNGVVAINDTSMTTAGNTSDTSSLIAHLGASNSAGSFLNVVFVEAAFWTNAVSDADIASLAAGFWATKYPSLPLP